ncbi:uncharacterized protein LOC144580101 isoform X3 [Callithrix jacchus]
MQGKSEVSGSSWRQQECCYFKDLRKIEGRPLTHLERLNWTLLLLEWSRHCHCPGQPVRRMKTYSECAVSSPERSLESRQPLAILPLECTSKPAPDEQNCSANTHSSEK